MTLKSTLQPDITPNPYQSTPYVKTYRMMDFLIFGKYKGETVSDVIDTDVQYLIWCYHQGIINFRDNVKDAIGYKVLHSRPKNFKLVVKSSKSKKVR